MGRRVLRGRLRSGQSPPPSAGGFGFTCVLKSPAGDPCAYLIRGALIALRRADADGVALERQVQETPAPAVAT